MTLTTTTTTTSTTSTTMVSDATFLDLERRLAVLEARVGVSRMSSSGSSVGGGGGDENGAAAAATAAMTMTIDDRLGLLRVDLERKICGSNAVRSTSERSWKEIRKLLRELDPGIALTHQQQPLLYKRQDVLAGSDELTRDFRELDSILKLLLTGTTVDGSESSSAAVVSSTTMTEARGTSSSTKVPRSVPSSAFTSPAKPLGLGGSGSGMASISSSTPATAHDSGTASPGKQKPSVGGIGGGSEVRSNQQLQARELHRKLRQQLQNEKQTMSSSSSGSEAALRRGGEGSATLRLDHVTQAPIVVQVAAARYALSPCNRKRLEDLRGILVGLNDRAGVLQDELRILLECYHTATTAASAKLVKANETIAAAAKKQQRAATA